MDFICPQAVQWGSVAEVLAAVGSIVIGWFLVRISSQANSTSDRLRQLEERRDDDAKKFREKEEQMLLISLAHPSLNFLISLNGLTEILTKLDADRFATDADVQRQILQILKQVRFEVPASVRSRMHFVDITVSARFLHIEAAFAMIIRSAENLASGALLPRIAKDSARNVSQAIPTLRTEMADLYDICRRQLELSGIKVGEVALKPMSDDVAELFQKGGKG